MATTTTTTMRRTRTREQYFICSWCRERTSRMAWPAYVDGSARHPATRICGPSCSHRDGRLAVWHDGIRYHTA